MNKQEEEMDSRKIVYKESGIVLIGEVICLALMLGVFALLGYFSMKVLLGGIVGTVLAVLNFFFMAVGAVMAADKAANQDVQGGKKQIKLSYSMRMILIFVTLFAFAKSGLCNPLASVLPLVFVRPIITVAEFFRK